MLSSFFRNLKLLVLFIFIGYQVNAQTTLINTQFNTTTLGALLSSDGVISPTKAPDGVCSQGMIQISNAGGVAQYLQADLPSCSAFSVNMKSTSTSARTVTVKYKKAGDTGFTILSPALSVLAASSFNLSDTYPILKTTGSIIIRLEATSGNTQVHDLVAISAGQSAAANITSFKMNGQIGDEVINTSNNTITLNVLTGTNLVNVAPISIGLSAFASISPLANATRDFSNGNSVAYTVTAEDGSTKTWSVVVSQITSAVKDVTDFKLTNNQLGASVIDKTTGTITVNVPNTTNLTAIVPLYIYISPISTINPGKTTARDFNSPVIYTLTAADNSTKNWTINVNKIDVTGFPTINFENVIGFASIGGDGFSGPTTGGAAILAGKTNDTVYVNGPSEFAKFCKILQDRISYKTYSSNPLTIVLEEGVYTGENGAETVWANSMLTIQDQANITIIGRRNVTLNFGINIKRSYNVLIRNISFQDYYDDGINIGEVGTHHVWVDHCTVGHPTTMPVDHEHPDGGIDVKDGASYVTVSWTKYRNSWKTGLVGHSDNNGAVDNGRLKVTYYANYFYHTNSRNPRVRFGEVHVLNNLEEQVMLYGIAASNNSSLYVENNFFLNTIWPMYVDRSLADFTAVYGNNTVGDFSSQTGNYQATGLKQIGNEYDDSALPVITNPINPAMLNPGGRSVKFDEFNPSGIFTPASYYNYTAMSASVVRNIVPLLAGADMVDFFPKANTNQVLPLDLIAFEAKIDDKIDPSVDLKWTTTNEVNTLKFEIERSIDGKIFNKIGEIKAKNISGQNQYSFTDYSPSNGLAYYRLKQLDQNGQFTFSEIVFIDIKNKQTLNVYPNPVKDGFTVNHEDAKQGASLKIIGLDGKLIFQRKLILGAQSDDVDTKILQPGQYILTFDNAGEKKSLVFIKL
jgi:pectate lyase